MATLEETDSEADSDTGTDVAPDDEAPANRDAHDRQHSLDGGDAQRLLVDAWRTEGQAGG